MKRPLTLCFVALMLPGCDKPAEKPPPSVVSTLPPAEAEGARRSATTPSEFTGPQLPPGEVRSGPPGPPQPPPTPAEIESFYSNVDAVVKEGTESLQSGKPLDPEAHNALRKRMLDAVKTRAQYMRRVPPDQLSAFSSRTESLTKIWRSYIRPASAGSPHTPRGPDDGSDFLDTPSSARPAESAPAPPP